MTSQIIHCVQLPLLSKKSHPNQKSFLLTAFISSTRIFTTSGEGNNYFRLDLNFSLDLSPNSKLAGAHLHQIWETSKLIKLLGLVPTSSPRVRSLMWWVGSWKYQLSLARAVCLHNLEYSLVLLKKRLCCSLSIHIPKAESSHLENQKPRFSSLLCCDPDKGLIGLDHKLAHKLIWGGRSLSPCCWSDTITHNKKWEDEKWAQKSPPVHAEGPTWSHRSEVKEPT